MNAQRYLTATVGTDLAAKMVFIGGPRQVGKTTLSLSLLNRGRGGTERHPAYLNWDDPQARAKLIKHELPSGEPLLIFDEIHKFPRWRSLVKGLYDTRKSELSILVTGSARLDYYRKGGDSLQGRYHYYRLHPFSLGELNTTSSASDLETLLRWGGFPEPLFAQSDRAWRRWHRERLQRVIHDDLRDLEHVKEIGLIDVLAEALPERVGSPLSVKSLREQLDVAHDTVDRWLRILERLYFCFRIPPFGSARIRAVKKEQKLYLWDWSQVGEPGYRFENLVASHLLKYCHFVEDTEGYDMQLRFLRDTDGREVDFVVMRDKKPLFAVECKTGERSPSPACGYFRARTAIPKFFQVHQGTKDFGSENTSTRVLPFATFCREIGVP